MDPADLPRPNEAAPGPARVLPQGAVVEGLVDTALDATVRTGEAGVVRRLIAELGALGGDSRWEAASLLLGLLATRPVYGLGEQQGVERLRAVARAAEPVTALVLSLQAVHRAEGASAARETWEQAPEALRKLALAQLFISVACTIGTGDGRLDPKRTVRLIRAVVIDAPAA
ncbi:hypothetical protein ACFWXO_21880 [Kitasatospora sp. NPDC059088]|uniref:hypothetical protein n=1 Tax=Kitasatospora sp. NPDC059088 TaxID=3346722 RepID=UPI00368B372B